mgnify:CR=1 FL=1
MTLAQRLGCNTEKQFVQLVLDRASTLTPSEFDYVSYIAAWDEEHMCGTVCCLLGWFPRFFPEQVDWFGFHPDDWYLASKERIGISRDLARSMFFGTAYYGGVPSIAVDASLPTVLVHLQNIINVL